MKRRIGWHEIEQCSPVAMRASSPSEKEGLLRNAEAGNWEAPEKANKRALITPSLPERRHAPARPCPCRPLSSRTASLFLLSLHAEAITAIRYTVYEDASHAARPFVIQVFISGQSVVPAARRDSLRASGKGPILGTWSMPCFRGIWEP